MRRTAARLFLIAGTLTATASTLSPLRAEDVPAADAPTSEQVSEGALLDQTKLPTAIEVKGSRPKADDSLLPPAATELPEDLSPFKAPPSLALPDKPSQVRIRELRPLTLEQAERLTEVNNPSLKAAASQVEQAKSQLLAAISAWYPTVNLTANGLPEYLEGEQYRNPSFLINPTTGERRLNPLTGDPAESDSYSRQWKANFAAQVQWNLIDPARVPQIASARDSYEKARDTYLIALRELRLNTATQYFNLQRQDEQVRIGQQSVRVSLVSLRDAKARFEAGVSTKLEVLEAETQMARDQQLLSKALGNQDKARRALAALLDLPQDVTPTAATPARVRGVWQPSLQESIVAAYAFREELDRFILDVSINNSNANAALAAVQPILSLVNTFSTSRTQGQTSVESVDMADYSWNASNTVALNASWNIFDGGRARAQYRLNKQKAEESEFNFASERDKIRQEVEDSFYDLRTANQDIYTTSREVLSSRESLRLARLRFQAGVTTQREVVDTQRDLTNAEVSYADAVTTYNISLAQLRRRTGLDQVMACAPVSLSSTKPVEDQDYTVPIEPTFSRPACQASVLNSEG
ncbi:TolC family protein [Synechococcus sp. UW140]|uniref:TolC family protein n=1 Tax=Synechococcus sp. UW140 TaxID=368503 RepID=UPI000E0F2D65|nr:TolC family protein [Synechococcus sp. UW140]